MAELMVGSHIIQGHFGSYYSMLFIPAGILLCLIIKYGSDLNVLNKGLSISSIGYDNYESELDRDRLELALIEAQKTNNYVFVIADTPIRLSEFGSGLLGFKDDSKIPPNHLNYLSGLTSFYELCLVSCEMLYMDQKRNGREAFAVRAAYDEFIRYGIFELNKPDISDFNSKNNIVSCNQVNSKFLFNRIPPASIINFNGFQFRILENRRLIFAKYNALFFLCLFNRKIKVINC